MKPFALIALVVLLCGCSAEPTVGVLRVCLGEDDLPRSAASPARGFDVDVARLLARGLHRELQPVWLPAPNPTEIESTDIDYGGLLAGRCNLQLSIPGQDALVGFAERLALTQPYYGAGFELVPGNAHIDLDSPGPQSIAVRANTVAHLLLNRRGFNWTMRGDSDDIAAAINSGEADVGLVWGPELARTNLDRSEAFDPPAILRWNHHGATRKSDVALRRAIDTVLARADVRQEIQVAMDRHGIPPRAPFESVHQAEMLKQ